MRLPRTQLTQLDHFSPTYYNTSVKYGLPEDVWFHVDDLSSAHVYLRMKPGMTLDDLPEELLLDCASLVKANSIQGCKVRLCHT